MRSKGIKELLAPTLDILSGLSGPQLGAGIFGTGAGAAPTPYALSGPLAQRAMQQPAMGGFLEALRAGLGNVPVEDPPLLRPLKPLHKLKARKFCSH